MYLQGGAHYWSVWQLKTSFISLYTYVLAYPVYGEWMREEMERERERDIYLQKLEISQTKTNTKTKQQKRDETERFGKKAQQETVCCQKTSERLQQKTAQHATCCTWESASIARRPAGVSRVIARATLYTRGHSRSRVTLPLHAIPKIVFWGCLLFQISFETKLF